MLQNVNNRLLEIKLAEIEPLLAEKHSADPVAGIAIVALPNIDIENPQGLKYYFHAARVFTSNPTTPNFVNPHYHLIGKEPYNILSGNGGEMNLGRVIDGKVEWAEPKVVKADDFIEVQEGEVHSLRNTGDTPLDFTFACPAEHLVNHSVEHPERDRYITKDLPNGIPPQYPSKA